MTFSQGAQACYVYVVLPGTEAFVTAGRFALEPNSAGVPTGQFVYGKSYLARQDAVALDPVELKLAEASFQTTALHGIFGALRDAGPDYWGRRLVEKRAGIPQLSEIDYLLNVPDDRIGALGFGLDPDPPTPDHSFNKILDLEKLLQSAELVIADEQAPVQPVLSQLEDLMRVSTSMGGARPKVVVEDEEGLWLAKFNRPDDRWNHARIEHAMLELASACGINSARSKVVTVGDRDLLLVRRFDRERTETGYLRARMVSGLTLLQTEDTHQNRDRWSYILLAEELRRISTRPVEDAAELFRRMAFNALISNTDDHPRNHAVIAWDQGWELSPAYDLTPSVPISLERRDLAMTCGDWGRYAHADNLLSQSVRFHLDRDEAVQTVKQMEERVAGTWREVARKAGVSDRDCETLARAFAYPGFRLPGQSVAD